MSPPEGNGHKDDCWCCDCEEAQREKMRTQWTTNMADESYDDAKEDYLAGKITFAKFVKHTNDIYADKDNLEILALLEEAKKQKRKIDALPKPTRRRR